MEAKPKHPYSKPTIERISLVGEMQVTASCKSVDKGPGKGKLCGHVQCKTTLGS
jgi:hypothetical protein